MKIALVLCLAAFAGFVPTISYAQPAPAAASTDNPLDVDSLDCEQLSMNINLGTRELLDPRQEGRSPSVDTQNHSESDAAAAAASKLDFNGLCHYRDANRRFAASNDTRVVFIGDSITENWALAEPQLFGGDVIGRGISGQSTSSDPA